MTENIAADLEALDPTARRICEWMVARLLTDGELRRRVERRHARMAAAWAADHPAATIAAAKRAGRRAHFLALLIEARVAKADHDQT